MLGNHTHTTPTSTDSSTLTDSTAVTSHTIPTPVPTTSTPGTTEEQGKNIYCQNIYIIDVFLTFFSHSRYGI